MFTGFCVLLVPEWVPPTAQWLWGIRSCGNVCVVIFSQSVRACVCVSTCSLRSWSPLQSELRETLKVFHTGLRLFMMVWERQTQSKVRSKNSSRCVSAERCVLLRPAASCCVLNGVNLQQLWGEPLAERSHPRFSSLVCFLEVCVVLIKMML